MDPQVLAAMAGSQAHRGPDDSGYHRFDLARGVAEEEPSLGPGSWPGAVGFRRLSIQDTSSMGHQPMISGDGRFLLVFNGEIYNAPELRRELSSRQVAFRGHSDTEVLLRLYEEMGEDFLQHLNGMFALAVVDLRRRRVLLARDRVGIKPLYFTRVGAALLFASEAKSFRAHPGFQPEVDGSAIDEYLQFRYCAGERTLMKGVFQLPPATVMSVTPEGGAQRRYWALPAGTTDRVPAQQAAQLLEVQLETSVRRQLLADVEVGCQLSGGIDSSLINLFAARHADAGMQAFSITLDDARFSEASWMREAAKVARVKSNEFRLRARDFIADLDRASWHLDQPINHPNSLGLLTLARHASKHVKVLLSGEGADELLGGYPRFFAARARGFLRPFLPALTRLPRLGPRIARAFGSGNTNPASFWVEASQRIAPKRAAQLLGRPLDPRATAARLELFEETPGVDYLTKCLNYEMSTYLVDLLMRQDKMTMAHSVENRVPFLDHELIEAVRAHISGDVLVAGPLEPATSLARRTKRPLKELSEKYFGSRFTYRPKSGFAIPLREFFRDPLMRERVRDELIPGVECRGIFDAGVVRSTWEQVERASSSDLDVLWSMLAFELWARTFVDGVP